MMFVSLLKTWKLMEIFYLKQSKPLLPEGKRQFQRNHYIYLNVFLRKTKANKSNGMHLETKTV